MGYYEDLEKNRDKAPRKGITKEDIQKTKDELLAPRFRNKLPNPPKAVGLPRPNCRSTPSKSAMLKSPLFVSWARTYS